MAQRHKRSISLPPELDVAIEQAAEAEGTSVSGWIADTAARRLLLEAGLHGVTEWETHHGALTPEELEHGRARAREALGRPRASRRRAS